MKRKLIFLAVLCSIVFTGCSAGDTNDNPIVLKDPVAVPKNSIVAHRGAWKKNNFPQNSIASLKEAIRLNCKGSEFDIHLTADDSLVVCHDLIYNKLNVQNSNYADIIKLKLSNGETLPTLREYIVAAKTSNTATLLFCELKNDGLNTTRRNVFVQKTLECVSKQNAQKLMVYTSFDYNVLKQIRFLSETADIRYITGDVTPEQLKLDKMTGTACPLHILKTSHPEWIDSMRKNNLVVGAGEADDEATIKWCLANLDVIGTNEPELAISLQAVYIK